MKMVTISASHMLHPRERGWIAVEKQHMFQSVNPAAMSRVWADPAQGDMEEGCMIELVNGVVLRCMATKADMLKSLTA
jgi:hypothetical protein